MKYSNHLSHQIVSSILVALVIFFSTFPTHAIGLPRQNDLVQAGHTSNGSELLPVPTAVQLLSDNLGHTAAGNNFSIETVISANGRYVAFSSGATDLAPNDLNGTWHDVFRRDLQTGTTELVSFNFSGTGTGDYLSRAPLISADGRYVAFNSSASDITPNAPVGGVFVRDMQSGVTASVSVTPQGITRMGRLGAMSADGRYVAFLCDATDLTAIPKTNQYDVYVRDMTLGITRMVSVNRWGTHAGDGRSGLFFSSFPAVTISPDGRYVGFLSEAADLVGVDQTNNIDLFVRDMARGTTKLVTINYQHTGSALGDPSIPVMSGNGRYIAFTDFSRTLVPQDTVGGLDVFVYDVESNTNALASWNRNNTASSNGDSRMAAITPDGRFVAFASTGTDLTAMPDTNQSQDVFIRDMQTGITTPVSLNRSGSGFANNLSLEPFLSADGRFVVFTSYATDLANAVDKNRVQDVFVRDMQSGATLLVSTTGPRLGSGNGQSEFPAIPADASFIVFQSLGTNFGAIDQNASYDVFGARNGFFPNPPTPSEEIQPAR